MKEFTSGSSKARQHLYAARERRYQQEREPYVQHLSELEHRFRGSP